jgi:sporulation protein YlmC with PRC-barrel domain
MQIRAGAIVAFTIGRTRVKTGFAGLRAQRRVNRHAQEVKMRSDRNIRRDIEWDDTFPALVPLPIDQHRFWHRKSVPQTRRFAAAALLLSATLISFVPHPARSQAVQIIQVDVKAVAQGYRASKLKGTNVVNDKNEKIGDIDDIIIGTDKKLLYAILEVGGFLGIGAQLVAVPFDQLNLDPTGAKITLPGGSKEELKKLPPFKYVS